MDRPKAGGPSPGSPPLVLYQLPTKSSSYILPLHTVLNKQAPKPPLARPPLKHPPAFSRPKPNPRPKPESKHAFQRAPIKTSSGVNRFRPASHSAKAAKSPAAAKRAPPPAPPPPAPAPELRRQEAGAKPDCSAARRALAKVILKIMDLEDQATWAGKARTAVTNERAEVALTALVTAEVRLGL